MQKVSWLNDNRGVDDRRAFSWQTVFYGFVRSRRRGARRTQDGEALFTDFHHPWLFFLAVGTMILSSLDAFLTLQLLACGAVEINPFMAVLIGHSTSAFAGIKLALTGVGLLALVFLARARFMNRIRTGAFLTVVFSLYACLICYQFVNLMAVI